MAAALPDTTNAKSTSGAGLSSVPITNCTCAGADNYLFAIEGNRTSGLALPTGITYGATSLTLFGSINDGVNSTVSVWTLPTPVTGTALTLTANYATGTANAQALAFVPYSGVGSVGTLVTAFSAANNNPAVTGTGGGANDSYISGAFNNDTAQTIAGGVNQVLLATQRANINGLCTMDFDYILGSNPGAFSWTGSGTPHGTNWAALALNVQAPTAGPLMPFTSTQFFVTDTIIQQ